MDQTLGNGGDAGSPPSIRDAVARTAMRGLLDAQAGVPARSALARALGMPVLTHETRPLYLDARTAVVVGSELERLPSAWSTLPDVPALGRGDAAVALAVGPPGVFAISVAPSEDHHLSGVSDPVARRISVRRGIRDSELTVGMVERRVSAGLGSPVRVKGLIVSPSAAERRDAPVSPDLEVVPAEGLARWLGALPALLAPEEVRRIVESAEAGLPHGPALGSAQDASEVAARFRRLCAEVEAAHRAHLRRLVIGGALLVLGIVATIVGIAARTGVFG